MFAALVGAMGEIAVPAEFALADLRAVISAGDLLLELFEVSVADIRAGGFAGPTAGGARISEKVEQIVLFLALEVAECGFVAAHTFAIEVSEAVEECALAFVSFGGEDEVDKAVDQCFFGAGSVGCGDDEVAEDNERFILMVVEEERLPIGVGQILRGVDAALRGSEFRGFRCGLRCGNRRAQSCDGTSECTCTKQFTSFHGMSPVTART